MKPLIIQEWMLTSDSLEEYYDFLKYHDYRGCWCFISPPCSYCTHSGNPNNLIEDEDSWNRGLSITDIVNQDGFNYGVGSYRLFMTRDPINWVHSTFAEDSYYIGENYIFFKNEKDRTLFVLKWCDTYENC